ncbi:MAG TPA: 3'-5' exonuclease [Gemmata sp.]|jgi:DNA polymerase-3 subunit epsilon|nr:3'-5' exonuclease [Gemmata sp.]
MSLKVNPLILDRPLAVVDLESTGVDPVTDRVVEVAILKLLPGNGEEWYHRRVNPGIPIPAAATAVHRIADPDVIDAPPFAAIADELFKLLDSCDLAGFGIAFFDLLLLHAEFSRAGLSFRIAGRRIIDVLTLYRRLQPRDLASAVRDYLGREHHDAHSAIADALATAEILNRQISRHGLPTTVAELHTILVEVDIAGRFRRDSAGRVVFAFGKHTGRELEKVAVTDPGYLKWMLDRPFLDDVHDLIRLALTSG